VWVEKAEVLSCAIFEGSERIKSSAMAVVAMRAH
jgi:hypothetical protein